MNWQSAILGPLASVLDELRKSLDGATKALRRFVRDAELARGSNLAEQCQPLADCTPTITPGCWRSGNGRLGCARQDVAGDGNSGPTICSAPRAVQ